jgi:hypothetical protein
MASGISLRVAEYKCLAELRIVKLKTFVMSDTLVEFVAGGGNRILGQDHDKLIKCVGHGNC